MDKQEVTFKNQDMDFLMKQNVANWFSKCFDKSAEGDFRGFFESVKRIKGLVVSYDFSSKGELDELENVLNEYFDSLKGGTPSRRDKILLRNKMERDLYKLLDMYYIEVVKAYSELGLWFLTRKEVSDFDLLLSDENFKDEVSSTKRKREFLKRLSSEELVGLASANAVHDMFSKFKVSEALNK